ncbi:MFS transporter, partial [Bacillus altitudinis]|uniref:MFS transporter n=1 Tax=Bacillus altitudinis TaxID=293387 RepID=UPI00119FB6EA
CCVCGKLTDELGGKKGIMGAAILFIMGGFGRAVGPNREVMVLFGMVVGLGVGCWRRIVGLYLCEVGGKE